MIKVPKKCLICGAEYQGGSVWEGEPMKPDLRVFYRCGASLSIQGDKSMIEDGSYILLVKNCSNDESVK